MRKECLALNSNAHSPSLHQQNSSKTVDSGKWFRKAVLQPALQGLAHLASKFPKCEQISENILNAKNTLLFYYLFDCRMRGGKCSTAKNVVADLNLGFLSSILFLIIGILKPVFAYILAVWFLVLLVRYLLSSSMSRTLTPLCLFPGISFLNLPFCSSYQGGAVEFDQLMTVQSAFEDVLSSSAGGATLPLDMKRSEASIRDLKHVVQYSGLPSRNELVFEFTGFIETARQAAADLTHFNSRIGRSIDHVLSTNRWTLQVIDGVAENEAARGALTRFLHNAVPAPFQSARITEDLLFEQYLRHTRAIEDQISELILEAQALLGILQNLDDRLDVIHSITTRDGISVKGDRDELLMQLWTILGGNRSSLNKQNEQLQLLRQVSVYRKTAWDHVSGTVLKLQSIAAGLDDLRERVSAPDVLGPRADVPLRTHIQHIQLGVDRLESQRLEGRKIEGEAHRRVLDRGMIEERKFIDNVKEKRA